MTDINAAAHRIAADLDLTERGLDEALARYGRLLASLAEGRTDAGLAATYGHEVFELATRIAPTLAIARGELVALHNRLGAVQRHQRIEMSPVGDKGSSFARAPEHLRLAVAS